jgi:predicted RNase H-like nuclease (RuvC/YqgF family)
MRRGYDLVECPKCGTEIETPVKTWSIPSRKTIEKGEKPKVVMGIFECPDCNARFRASVPTKTENEDTVSIKNMIEKIKGVKGELMQTLKELRGKIKSLESERSNLMIEIEKLKKMAESKATALESEVSMLREEVESLRELLGYTEEAKE